MKFEYRLQNDIVNKALTAEAGSFDTFTVEWLEMIIAISEGIKFNWSKILYNILIAIISTTDKQHEGYNVQICHLVRYHRAEMWSSTVLYALKVLNEKSISFYRSKNVITRDDLLKVKKEAAEK